MLCSCSGDAKVVLTTDDDTLDLTLMGRLMEYEMDPLHIACPDPTDVMTLESYTCTTYKHDRSVGLPCESVKLQDHTTSIFEILLVDAGSAQGDGSNFYVLDAAFKCSATWL